MQFKIFWISSNCLAEFKERIQMLWSRENNNLCICPVVDKIP